MLTLVLHEILWTIVIPGRSNQSSASFEQYYCCSRRLMLRSKCKRLSWNIAEGKWGRRRSKEDRYRVTRVKLASVKGREAWSGQVWQTKRKCTRHSSLASHIRNKARYSLQQVAERGRFTFSFKMEEMAWTKPLFGSELATEATTTSVRYFSAWQC